MTDPAFEAFLARLYTDADFCTKFLADPRGTAAGLTPEQILALERIDREGLELASRSFLHKREQKRRWTARKSKPWWRFW
jgi:hypothetical protein